jgi:hypothetical protein
MITLASNDNKITNTDFAGNKLGGCYVNGSGNYIFTGCKAFLNFGFGLYIFRGQKTRLINCESQENNGNGITILEAPFTLISNCVSDGNGSAIRGGDNNETILKPENVNALGLYISNSRYVKVTNTSVTNSRWLPVRAITGIKLEGKDTYGCDINCCVGYAYSTLTGFDDKGYENEIIDNTSQCNNKIIINNYDYTRYNYYNKKLTALSTANGFVKNNVYDSVSLTDSASNNLLKITNNTTTAGQGGRYEYSFNPNGATYNILTNWKYNTVNSNDTFSICVYYYTDTTLLKSVDVCTYGGTFGGVNNVFTTTNFTTENVSGCNKIVLAFKFNPSVVGVSEITVKDLYITYN